MDEEKYTKLHAVINEDIAKASARLRYVVFNNCGRAGNYAEWILQLRRYEFVNLRNVGEATANELQLILERRGAAERYCQKKTKSHEPVTDKEAVAMLVKIARDRFLSETLPLLDHAIDIVKEEDGLQPKRCGHCGGV